MKFLFIFFSADGEKVGSDRSYQIIPLLEEDYGFLTESLLHNETLKLFLLKRTLQLHWHKTFTRNVKNDFHYAHGMLIIKQ